MRPPVMLVQLSASAIEQERHRGEERRHALQRALAEARQPRLSASARLVAAAVRRARRENHSLTDYPCRLPDGKIGRTAVVERDGEWMLVCRVA
ncbi:MAG TPA: hypothetical protein VER83_03655 [Candidatus Nanopelagicales bacterium]|nr:hypothetical protein [Candidatus Nanopelagicales bacterium]